MFPFELLSSEMSAATVALTAWGVSKDKLTVYLRSFQIQRRILRKPGGEALKQIVLAVL